MKIIFCSSIYNMNTYDDLCKKSRKVLSLADHNLNSNIIFGVDENLEHPISLINNEQIPTYPDFRQVVFHREKWQHAQLSADINCGFINLPVLKHLTRKITTYNELKKFIKSESDKDIVVVEYGLHWAINKAILKAKKKFPFIKTCVILPDIPTEVLISRSDGRVTTKYKFYAWLKTKVINKFDSYVFITSAMKEIVGEKCKYSCIMEGIYNNRYSISQSAEMTDKKVILYSGQLNPDYGVDNLLKAFINIDKDNYELWLFGAGILESRIRLLAKEDPRIKYFGYVNSQKIYEYQKQATLLINPRQNIGTFNKFSFPSKTMEYLASGKPVVGYKLDGIPNEYNQYISYVEDNSVQTLSKKIIEICELSEKERMQMGERSKEFILTEKNPKVMTKRIVDMWQEMFDEKADVNEH